MTNKQIIRAAAERLDPATLHQIATAHHTPEEIAAVAASCKIVDKDGNEKPATAADIEIMFAADELHTFDFWKKEGKSVKKGEKALTECYLWKYTTKPSKEQREKAAAEGKEAAPDPHYYPTKSHLFSCLQVESSKPAPQARFKSTAEIIAYNKKLAAERKAAKAAKEAAEKAADEAPAVTVSMEELEPVFESWYSNFYRTHDDNDSKEYREAVKTFDQKSKNDPEFSAIVQQFTNYRCDFISSDREAAAFVMALDELNHKHNAPEMVPSVQQLDFASIAAGVLA